MSNSRQKRPDPYLAFAEWRIAKHRSHNLGKSVRFFRRTRDHTIIWSVVMRGHYAGSWPTMSECIQETCCSENTVRKIIGEAEALGYLTIEPASHDSRMRLIVPTSVCLREYENMVDGYRALVEMIYGTGKSVE